MLPKRKRPGQGFPKSIALHGNITGPIVLRAVRPLSHLEPILACTSSSLLEDSLLSLPKHGSTSRSDEEAGEGKEKSGLLQDVRVPYARRLPLGTAEQSLPS